jgi:hypothetical protein
MKRNASNGFLPPDLNQEIKELKILLKELEARLAPGEEITEEVGEVIRRMRKTLSNLL